jgi:cyanophycinase-like exopeptidase
MAETGSPVFLIAGGPSTRLLKGPDPLLREVFRLAGVRRPSVAYVGAASGDDPAFQDFLSRRLMTAGAGDVTLAPLAGRDGNTDRAKAVIEEADLVFVSGGDVDAGMRLLRATGMIDFLCRLFRAGKPFCGTSAGSIMLARRWIRWQDPDDDATAEPFDCLGLVPLLCDTHGETERWGELKALLALSPIGTIGHGIPSGAALVMGPEGKASALGGTVIRFRREAGRTVRIEDLIPDKL